MMVEVELLAVRKLSALRYQPDETIEGPVGDLPGGSDTCQGKMSQFIRRHVRPHLARFGGRRDQRAHKAMKLVLGLLGMKPLM